MLSICQVEGTAVRTNTEKSQIMLNQELNQHSIHGKEYWAKILAQLLLNAKHSHTKVFLKKAFLS